MPIQVLSPQLANQIAAGEIVERPAAVVKELIENSLDAEATCISIDIECGGSKRIRIQDNGRGIDKAELALALARHATSKIDSLDDLETITSMGFRGEALASISAVSRLTLTSRPSGQREAWQVYTEGSNLAITLKPTAHPVGTTVEVMDLFYNRPARRKFMCTIKTEFTYIDDVIRCIALSRFNVTFMLQHNGKLVRQYRAVSQPSQYLSRLRTLCGTTFVEQVLSVSWQDGNFAIYGWIADLSVVGKLPNMQYCYVNRRPIRNKLINHAIRQAYQQQLTGMQKPVFVLFIIVDPHQLDINVHPSKHEIRFHQARLVHHFIYQAIKTVLQHRTALYLTPPSEVESYLLKKFQASRRNNCYLPNDDPNTLWVTLQAEDQKIFNLLAELVAARQQYLVFIGTLAKRQPLGSSVLRADYLPACAAEQTYQSAYRRRKNHRQLTLTTSIAHSTGTALSKCNSDYYHAEAAVVSHPHTFGRVLTVVQHCYALVESVVGNLALLSLPMAARSLHERQLILGSKRQQRIQPLLIPLRLTLSDAAIAVLQRHQRLLQDMGIMLQIHRHQVKINAVPLMLHQQKLHDLIPDLLSYLEDEISVTNNQVAVWLARWLQHQSVVWSHSRAIQLLAEIERLCPQWVQAPPAWLLVKLNFEDAINTLNHD